MRKTEKDRGLSMEKGRGWQVRGLSRPNEEDSCFLAGSAPKLAQPIPSPGAAKLTAIISCIFCRRKKKAPGASCISR